MLLLEFRNVIRPDMKSALMSNIISLNVDTIKVQQWCIYTWFLFTFNYILAYPISVSTYHLRTIENTLLVNCVLMCFIIFCFTAGALALYRSVGRGLYYYGVYEFVTRKTRSDCPRIRHGYCGFLLPCHGFVYNKCATKYRPTIRIVNILIWNNRFSANYWYVNNLFMHA
jgi:hypothetical protein